MGAFDDLIPNSQSSSAGAFDDLIPQAPKQNTGIIGDIGTALKRGVLQMPGMATGLADIAAAPVSIATGVNRPVSRASDWLGEQTGFQPSKWAEAAGAEYSPEMQQAQRNVEEAKGFFPTIGAVAQNPRVAAQLVAESLPSTIAGGLVARGAMGAVAGAQKLNALRTAAGSADAAVANAARRELLKSGAIAAGVGEGAVTAGQQMSQTGYDVDPALAAGTALGAGVGTGIIGGLSGRVAGSAIGRKLGLSDIETSMAAGTLGENTGKAGAAGFAKRIGAGAIQEGLLEEAPQSYQEQVWQNIAAGKPATEGPAEAAALGAVAGGAMGAGVNIASGPLSKAVAAAPGAAVPPVVTVPTAGIDAQSAGERPANFDQQNALEALRSKEFSPVTTLPIQGENAPLAPVPTAGIASAAQQQQTPTAMPVPQAIQNAPAAPGSPSPVPTAEPLPSANAAESAGAPQQRVADLANRFEQAAQGLDELSQFSQQEVADVRGRRSGIVSGQKTMREAKLEAADARVETARQKETAARRNAILDGVDLQGETNIVRRFEKALAQNGIAQNKATPEDRARLARRVSAAKGLSEDYPPIPSATNELVLPERRATSAAASGRREQAIADLAKQKGVRLKGNALIDANGRKRATLTPKEIEAVSGIVQIARGKDANQTEVTIPPTQGPEAAALPVAAKPAGSIAAALQYPKQATEGGAPLAQQAADMPLGRFGERQKIADGSPAIRDANSRESAAAARARQVLDLRDNDTGWKAVDYPNGDGVLLISYDGKKAVDFPSKDKRSGTAGLRASSSAQAYAIDNPYSIGNAQQNDLVITPAFKKKPDISPEVTTKKATRIASSSGIAGALVTPQQPTFGGAPLAQTPTAMPIGKYGKAKAKAAEQDAEPQQPKAKGLEAVAQRQVNAANRFVDSAVEQFGLSRDEATAAWNYYLKNKLVKVDAVGGQFNLKDGRLWDANAMKKAASEFTSRQTPAEAPQQPLSGEGERQTIASLQSAYNEAKAKLEAISPEPRKPSTERQAFGTKGKAGAPADEVAKYEASVKAYVSWKAKYNRLKKAEVEASNALFAAKKAEPQPKPRQQPQPAPIMRRDDLVGAIMRVTGGDGIASNMAPTIAGDTAGRGLSKLRGLFTNRGTIDLGEVATRLREDEGFDVRDGEHLSELIRAASFGDTAVSMERAERDQDTAEEKRYRDYIRQNAKKLKIKTVAVKFTDLEQRVIAALTRRHERAVELLDERAKKWFDVALEESYALLPEDVVDAVLVDVSGRGLPSREFWNQATETLRYMVADAKAKQEQEALNAIEGAEPDWLKDDGQGNQPAGGGKEANRVAEEARGEAYSIGDEITFTPNPERRLDSEVSGILVAKESTGGGRFRLRIRTDRPSPQGDGFVTLQVYSQNGSVQKIGDGLNADRPASFGLASQTPEEIADAEAAAKEAKQAEAAAAAAESRKEKAAKDKAEKDRRAAEVLKEREAAKKAEVDKAAEEFALGQAAPEPVVKKVTTEEAAGQKDIFAAPAPDSSSRLSFAGQQSATADQFQLDRAKQLLADGANANAVRQQTGWFKSPSDGKWRYEIDDSGASLKAHGFSFGELLDALGKNLTLADVLDHPALFAAYPAIARSSVDTIDEKSKNNGELSKNQDGSFTILVNAGLGEAKALSVMLHEIQHGIQNVEGFASGGNMDQFVAPILRKKAELEKRVFEINRLLSRSKGNEYLKLLEDRAEIVGEIRRLPDDIGALEQGYKQYRKLAGEVESRNVQQRQNFPADKRKYSDPLGTQDVAPEDVIVMFNGKDAKDAPAPFNTTRASAMAAVGASPADAAVFGMASDGKSAQEILSFLSKASHRPFNRVLASALSRIGVSSTVSIDPAAGWRNSQNRQGAKFAASYNPKTDTVSLFTPREAERHVLHEFVHSATLKAIARGGPAARQMQAIFDYVQRTGTMSDQYGMGNFSRFPNETDAQFKRRALDEFTAELFTNPQFQVRLKQLPAPSGSKLKSAWDWIVRVIANMLGLKTRAQETALDRALSVGAALLQENAALTMPAGQNRYSAGAGGRLSRLIDSTAAAKSRLDAFDKGITSGKVADDGKYFDRIDAVMAAENALAEEIAKIPDDALAVRATTSDGRMVTFTKSAQQEGKYQITRFDAKGDPWGDTLYPTKLQAAKEFVSEVDVKALEVSDGTRYHTTWHGSPHKFYTFDLSKIGTGEGAQAYGHGLYVAEAPEVAERYRDQLAGWKVPNGWSEKYPESARGYIRGMVGDVALGRETPERAARLIANANINMRAYPAADLAKELSAAADYAKGGFYKVDLPAEAVARMLDWDAALSNQPPEVQSALKDAGIADVDKWTDAGLKGRELYNRAKRGAPAKLPLSQSDDQSFASARLKQAGILGIRYLDQQSRSGEKATSNFVLFDDKLARIIEVNGVETGVQPWAPGEWEATQGGERFSQEQPFSGREVAATPLKPGTKTVMVDGIERPALNSNGKPIHWSEEGVRNFYAWFKDSKVVDEQGRPLVVYHGTRAEFSVFDYDRIGDQGRGEGAGFYFTNNKSVASGYGTPMEVYLSIKKPMAYDAKPFSKNVVGKIVKRVAEIEAQSEGIDAGDGFLSNFGDVGYDGLVPVIKKAAGLIAADVTALDQLSGIVGSGVNPSHVNLAAREVVGYDGVFASGFSNAGSADNKIFVAFFPEQIKSATGNTGAFSPEDPDIRYSLATNWQQSPVAPGNLYQAAKKKAASILTPERLDKVIYEMQDKFVDLRRIRDHIKEIGGTITDLNDAYLGEELYHKRLAYRTEQFLKEELQPFFADMKARGVTMPEFEKFLHARHAPEANAEMAKRNPNQKQIDAGRQQSAATVRGLELNLQTAKARGLATVAIEKALTDARAELAKWNGAQAFKGTEAERLSLSGMSNADASTLMASLTPAQRADMDTLAAKVDAINEGTLQTLERYGLMDKAALNTWRNTYKHYVPLHRDEAHPDSVSHPIGQGFNVRGDASKRRTGSNQEVTNIFSHIAMQREAALTRGEKNRVMQKLYLMARQNPIPEIWSVGKVPMIDTIDKETGFVRSVPDPQYKDKPNVITLRIAGKDVAIVMNEYNPQALRLAQSIKNLDVDDLHYLIPVVGKATRLFASINTQYNPIFGLINFARDVQTAALNLSTTEIAGKQKEVFNDTMSILGDIIKNKGRMPTSGKWAPIYKEFNEVGGTTGYRDLFLTTEDRSKAVTDEIKALDRGKVSQVAHAVASWLSDYNEAMENATRLAAYKAAIDNGMSKERAASLAKNLTVNFNRKGRQTRELGALYAFFNAAVQGTARMAQTLSGPAGKKIMLGGVLAGAASAMAGIAAMGGGDGEDDEWSKIPEFVKERSFIIPAGKDKYIAIPMPLGFHFLPNIGRLAVEMAIYKDKTLGKQMASLFTVLADAFNPLGGSAPPMQIIAPTVMDPFVALAQNKDWTGKPIYVENFNSLNPQPGAARAKDSATPIAKGLAEAINTVTGGTKYVPGGWSPTPDQIDYVIGQLTGGVGREVGKLSSTIAAPFTGDELPAHKIPLLGRLYGSTAGATGQASKFYENIKRANEVENELKGRRKDGISVADYLEENPGAAELAARGNLAERQIRALRQMRSRIVEAGGDDAASKAKQINERMATVMRGFNMQVERMQ